MRSCSIFAVTFALLRGQADPKLPANVCALTDAPYFADADFESEDYHMLTQKGPSTTTEPALANLENAQAEVQKAEKALASAQQELHTAVEDLLEVPKADPASLLEEVNKKEKDLLVVFYAPWCPHCQTFVLHDGSGDPRKAPLELLSKKLTSDSLKVLRFDVTAGQGPADMPVEYIPTVYFAKKDGTKTMFQGDPHQDGALEAFVKQHS